MEKEKFTNIDNIKELPHLLKATEIELKLFLYICSKMTFKQSIFGVFSQVKPSKIVDKLNFRDSTHLKQTLLKLEKANILFIVNYKDNLILSKTKISLDDLKLIIENNYTDFNLNTDRLNDLKSYFNWKLDFKAIYAKKLAAATKPPIPTKKALEIDSSEHKQLVTILDEWDEIINKEKSIL